MSISVKEAGQLGGKQTLKNKGKDHFKLMGIKSGEVRKEKKQVDLVTPT